MKGSKIALLAACLIGTAGLASAADTAAPQQGAPKSSRMHMQHFDGGASLAHLVHRLELTDAQRQSVRALFESARPQHQALREQHKEAMVSGRTTMPDDPNYPALVEKRKQLAAQAIQQRSDMDVQLYALLTPEQKTQLATLAQDPPKRRHQWRGDKTHQHKHRGERPERRSGTQL